MTLGEIDAGARRSNTVTQIRDNRCLPRGTGIARRESTMARDGDCAPHWRPGHWVAAVVVAVAGLLGPQAAG